MLNWAITSFLLALVSVFFSVAGTDGQSASLWGRIVAASFLVLAVALIIGYVKDRHRHPGAH